MAEIQIVTAEILDEDTTLTIEELSLSCHVQRSFILELVEYGVLEPVHEDPKLLFDAHSFKRLLAIARLQRDFNLNMDALSLIIDLIDEVHELRNRVQILEE